MKLPLLLPKLRECNFCRQWWQKLTDGVYGKGELTIRKLNITPAFTIEDIHKVREYHYELTKDMTAEERRAFYKKLADDAEKRIQEFRERRKML
jgi:hypothetical protein